jgi:hypothetical protein
MSSRSLHVVKFAAIPLRCLECGCVSRGAARGWRAIIGGGYEGEPLAVGVYCPACALREFGE